MRIGYTPAARDDLKAIGDYIAADSRRRAQSFVRELRQACSALGDEPFRYPLMPLLAEAGVRRRPYNAYAIFYRVIADNVQILRVLHSARDVQPTDISPTD